MLLVIYNSNPSNKPDIPTSRGWSLYPSEDWASLCTAVDNYFFYLPSDDAELSFGLTSYYSYKEWLADYQVSEVDVNKFTANFQLIDILLGTDFYVPDFLPIEVEEIYPEMDAYA